MIHFVRAATGEDAARAMKLALRSGKPVACAACQSAKGAARRNSKAIHFASAGGVVGCVLCRACHAAMDRDPTILARVERLAQHGGGWLAPDPRAST